MAQLRRAASIGAALAVAALLAGSGLTAPDQGVPPEKAALEQHAERVQADARARAAGVRKPPDPAAERPQTSPAEPPPTGIVELPSPFPAREYLLDATGWQQVGDARRITVYAGALGSDPRQGVLAVVTTTLPAADEYTVEVYPAPSRGGALHLVAARGDTLTLRDDAGRTLGFDVSARSY